MKLAWQFLRRLRWACTKIGILVLSGIVLLAVGSLSSSVWWIHHNRELGSDPIYIRRIRVPYSTALSVSLSPDGKYLAACGNQNVSLWDTSSWREMWRINTGFVYRVVFSPDGKRLATTGRDQFARLWDVATGSEITRFRHDDTVTALCFSPDGRSLATAGYESCCRIWDLETGTTRARCVGHVPKTKDGVNLIVESLAFSPTGNLLATGAYDQTVRIWSPTSGEQFAVLQINNLVECVAFSPDGHTLACGDSNGFLTLWDVEHWTIVSQTRFWDRLNQIRDVAFAPTGRIVAVAGTGQVCLLDMDTGQITNVFGNREPSFDHPVMTSLAFSPDGSMLVIGAQSSCWIRIVDVNTVTLHVGQTTKGTHLFSQSRRRQERDEQGVDHQTSMTNALPLA